MIVKAQLSRLRRTEWWEYLVRFVFGGLVTVVAGLIAKEYGPAVGGLFLAFPGIFPAGVTLVERHEEQKKRARGLHGERRARRVAGAVSAGAVLGAVALACFAATAAGLFKVVSPWLGIALAALVWVASAVLMWWSCRRGPRFARKTFRR
jgi:hypothetical protein